MTNCCRVCGFSLYELMLVVAISAILMVVSCVDFQSSWVSLQAQSLRYVLQQSTLSASLSARKSDHAVKMCGQSSDKGICSSDWSRGWWVIDEVTSEVIEQHDLPGRLSLKWSGGLGRVPRFRSDGRPDGVQGGWRCKFNGRELFHEVLLRVI